MPTGAKRWPPVCEHSQTVFAGRTSARCAANGATAQGTAAVTLGVGAHENGGGVHELRAGNLNQLLRVVQGQFKELLGVLTLNE